MRTPKVVSSGRIDSSMRTVSFGPSTRKLPVPADTAFSKISMLRNGIIPGTYSLIHIKYAVGNGTYTEEITIPFFISNMVNVDIYSKIKIGQEYDTEIMRAITRSASDIQTTTKDSSYTIYTEYMYSANRIEFDEELYMNKGFRLYEAPNPYISVGTKLTLMYLTFSDNPRTYYYEVNSETSFIPLTAFIDEKGNHYKERNINLLSELPEYSSFTTMYVNGRTLKKYNRGVEKYLLFVDCRN